MISRWIYRTHDYHLILKLLVGYLKKKWRLEFAGVVSVLLMMLLGVLLPAIASELCGLYDNFFRIAFIYTSIAIVFITVMIIADSKLTMAWIVYEAKYSGRLLQFMLSCYHNMQSEYDNFIKENFESRDQLLINYDHTVIRTIFFKIFSMYFYTMNKKMKNPEPYLIDMQEMHDLYTSRSFNDFYSKLFFSPTPIVGNTPYEQVIVDILDGVLTKLYSKPWFVDYYNDEFILGMIKYILANWYKNIVPYGSCQPIDHAI